MIESLRIGVVGGGLISQVVHLGLLGELDDLFSVAALAEPSPRVRELLARRHRIARAFADHEAMLEAEALDAVLVASPNGTHADVVLDCLRRGVHVLVEKPLCIAVADADRIIAERDRAGRVVQVGYMKRFDPAYAAMLADLPADPRQLRFVATVTHDPGLARLFAPRDMVIGSDVPAAVRRALERRTIAQVAQAVGVEDPALARAFSETFLGALVHDVNLVHGVLERIGIEHAAARVAAAASWANGEAACGTVELPLGARWTMAWLLLPEAHGFRETIRLFLPDGLRTLEFPAPYLRPAPARYTSEAVNEVRTVCSYRASYERQLVHFHACVTAGAASMNSAEEARADIDLLSRLFEAAL